MYFLLCGCSIAHGRSNAGSFVSLLLSALRMSACVAVRLAHFVHSGLPENNVTRFASGTLAARSALPVLLFSCMLPSLAAAQPVPDPWEFYNRPVYMFNQILDGYVIKPVALTYSNLVPGFAKKGVTNFFNNLDDVNVIVNDVLQFKLNHAFADSSRLLLNTTVGMGGLFDVAAEMGMDKRNEDFGQTLGHWGFKDGGYMVLPLMGASTVRDTVGLIPDMFFNPLYWIKTSNTQETMFSMDTIDTRLKYVAAEDMIRGDEYIFVRNAYLQRRVYLVADGEVYDEFDDF